MKKTIALFALATVALFAVGCSNKLGEDMDDGYEDSYLYQSINGVYSVIDTETAVATPLCIDPLCTHRDSDCLFYCVENPMFIGRYMYFLAEFSEQIASHKRLCRYDLSTDELETVYRADGGYILQGAMPVGDCIQFTVYLSSGKYGLMLFDRASGEVKTLNEAPLDVPHYAVAASDGRIYWKSSDGEAYSTNESYGDRKDGDTHPSEAAMYESTYLSLEATGEMRGKFGAALSVYKVTLCDLDSGQKTVVFEETPAYPFLYKDKIFYYEFPEEPLIIGYEDAKKAKPIYEKRGGKLYICDRNGEGGRLLLDIGGMKLAFAETAWLDGKKGVGDYIGIELYSYEENADGTLTRGENKLMLVNIVTGEYKLVTGTGY